MKKERKEPTIVTVEPAPFVRASGTQNMDFSGKLAEAQRAHKEATKLSAPTFLGIRMKADWSSATPLWEKAALLFQQAGAHDRAAECWISASRGHKAQDSIWHAAKALEKAAELETGTDQIYTLYVDSAELYVEAGRPQTAAEAASRGACKLSEADPTKSSKLHALAIKWLEESGKEGQSPDIYRQAALHAVRSQQWADAIKVELGLALSAYNARAYSTSCKAYLAAIVIALYGEDGRTAWCTYQDALAVPEFASSDQAHAAQDLVRAVATGDKSAIDACVAKNSCFGFLDNCIVRLAKKMGATDVLKTARGLPKQGSLTADEDLT